MNILWACQKLKEGKMVRRKIWIDCAYLFILKDRNYFEDIRLGWFGKENVCEVRDLIFSDLEGNDWELATKEKFRKKTDSGGAE